MMSEYLDSCLVESEKTACAKTVRKLFRNISIDHERMTVISGQLLAEEIISRGEFEKVKSCQRVTVLQVINPTNNLQS